MTKEELMHRAIELSKNSVKTGGGPFGAVIAKDVVETYGLGQPQSITRNKKVLVEKDLVEKHLQDFSFVDPVFELWLKREYNILP